MLKYFVVLMTKHQFLMVKFHFLNDINWDELIEDFGGLRQVF
jgi:hypothetical protein